MWRDGVGIFTPGTDMASDAGMEVLNGPRDMAKVRAAIKDAGYNGEKSCCWRRAIRITARRWPT